MRFFLFFVALPMPLVAAFSFNTYDLGLHGFYPRQHFHSSNYQPPAPKITRYDSRCDPGNLLLTPRGPSVSGKARGPVMLDAKGNLVWMDNDKFQQALDLNVQQYKGEDYLTFWTNNKKIKKSKKGKKGKGKKNKKAKEIKKSYVMLNSTYEVAHRIHPQGHGLKADSHEFRITPEGTALITIYYKHKVDCTDMKLGKGCWIQDGIFQEIDIETGKLLFEWRATDHIRMSDLFSSPNRKDGYGTSKQDAFDFFHINSVDKTDSGDYLISARYMHAIVCISAKTGDVLWQLGGKNNNFEDLDRATDFAWQHHVTWQGNNTISVFDNHANNVFHRPSKHSKGMIIKLDMDAMTAHLVGKYVHPDEILNVSQGSVQILPTDGNVLVGFGNSPTYIEYTAEGEVLCAAHFAPHITFELIDFGMAKSYRVFKHPWVGRPKTVPALKIKKRKAYVSWNGATEVVAWRLQTQKNSDAVDEQWVTLQELERDGFETTFTLEEKKISKYVRMVALDAAGEVLAYSDVKKPVSASVILFWTIMTYMSYLAAFILGISGSFFLYQRYPRLLRLAKRQRLPRNLHFLRSLHIPTSLHLPMNLRFPNISDFRRRRRHTSATNHEYDDSESNPLLLDEREP